MPRDCGTEVKLPERIDRLDELAYNLWWSWHPEARNLFRKLDHPLWSESNHNPVKQLREISEQTLQSAASDEHFIRSYDAVMAAFDAEMASVGNRIDSGNDHLPLVAFFSMEFAIHQSLPMYAGGLGILAGDICKEASDLGLPVVALGFMYPQGYFFQRVSSDGWQEEVYQLLDFNTAPLSSCPDREGNELLLEMRLGNQRLLIKVWLVRIGKINLYLLDTDLVENTPQDRLLTARLYTADKEQRLKQEMVLGISGVRVLQALGLEPSVWHANEGHTSFMMLERLRQEVEKGSSFSEGMNKVQTTTLFTTHTPVAAGHDVFPVSMVHRHLRDCFGKDESYWQEFLDLGKYPNVNDGNFNMTVLGFRLSGIRNAVSAIHEKTSQTMWQPVLSATTEKTEPITRVTNGVHLPTWIAPEMSELYARHLGTSWLEAQDDAKLWEKIESIPDEELWAVRQVLKRTLVQIMLARNRECSSTRVCSADQVLARGAMFDVDTLTIGFGRRFTEYKRPELILSDTQLLKKILTDQKRPVQLVFAGKSHPADFASKSLLNRVYASALDRNFEGRIAFIEDYDIHLAHNLVSGVDVWLNTPRRLEEACGTSGMKAALNGTLNFSVPDGWWYEVFNQANGWIIGNFEKPKELSQEDIEDARSLYETLGNSIIPLYYERDRAGIPHGWVRMIKDSICSIVPRICARRMMHEYYNLYRALSLNKYK